MDYSTWIVELYFLKNIIWKFTDPELPHVLCKRQMIKEIVFLSTWNALNDKRDHT